MKWILLKTALFIFKQRKNEKVKWLLTKSVLLLKKSAAKLKEALKTKK